MPYKDKKRQLEYQKRWIAARRKAWFDEHGPCVECGSWYQLELDHIDPSQKEDHKVWSWCAEKREKELAKCQVLCHNCHMKKSIAQSFLQATHGTRSMYFRHNCRCQECCEAKETYNARRRQRKTYL